MPINIDNTYRIKRNQDQEEQMQYLVRDLKVFNSYSQILTISALIGYVNNEHPSFSRSAEPVQVTFFEEREKEIMNFLAYMMAGNQAILQEKPKDDPNRNKMYEAFENYANGGFPILCKKLGIDFVEKSKNDRLTILQNYYTMLLSNELLDLPE
jgi:dnd system-associated protein 4